MQLIEDLFFLFLVLRFILVVQAGVVYFRVILHVSGLQFVIRKSLLFELLWLVSELILVVHIITRHKPMSRSSQTEVRQQCGAVLIDEYIARFKVTVDYRCRT